MKRISGRREVMKPNHIRVHGVVDWDENTPKDEIIETIGRWAGFMLAEVAKAFDER